MATIEDQLTTAKQTELNEFNALLKSFIRYQLQNVPTSATLMRVIEPKRTLLTRFFWALHYLYIGRKLFIKLVEHEQDHMLLEIKYMPYFSGIRLYTDVNGQLFVSYTDHNPYSVLHGMRPFPITAEELQKHDLLAVASSAIGGEHIHLCY